MISNRNIYFLIQRSYSQTAVPVPVIKIPKYVSKYVEKRKTKELDRQQNLRRKIIYRGNTSIKVISSTEGEYNHYLGQLYNDRIPLPLLTKYWYKPKTAGQKFTIHRYDTNPSLPVESEDEIEESHRITDFSMLNINESICNTLKNDFNITAPTPIQNLAVPPILEGKHVILAAEAGCGKTIAYLAPIIHQLSLVKGKIQNFPNSPLALIIVPGRELAEQIADVSYRLGYNSRVTTKVLLAGGTEIDYLKPDQKCDVDILVTTLGSIVKLKNRVFKLSNLKHLILDEADTLTDDSFIGDLSSVMQKLLIRSDLEEMDGQKQGAQISFVSTIYPSNISGMYSDFFNESQITKICSNYLHRIQPHVEQKFWRVTNDSRAGELLYLAKTGFQKKEPTLIFCNKSTTCDWMSSYLKDNGVPTAKLHGAVSPQERSKIFQAFQNGEFDILICTDLVSRGLDTQRVKHVINFDFPNSTSDYILRCGRVGRVGTNQGHITSLVVSKSGIYCLQDIEAGVRNAVRIPNVNSNIKKKINKLYFTH